MSYRIEISPNNRAGCSAPHCKSEGVKIIKGDIRQGVLVMFNENQSWKYRHWGCVTPPVLHNWKETTQNNWELVDGLDTLPADAQERVKRALEQGHVDDEDWRGDIECNRYNGKKNQPMFLKKSKKADGEEDSAGETSPAKKPAAKKRGRAKRDDPESEAEEKPAPKKAGGRKAAKAKDHDTEPEDAPPAKKARKSAKAKMDEENPDMDVPASEPAAEKTRGRKAKPAVQLEKNASATEAGDADAAPAPSAKKTRARKGAKQSTEEDVAEQDVTEPKAKSQKRKARGKKGAAAEDEE